MTIFLNYCDTTLQHLCVTNQFSQTQQVLTISLMMFEDLTFYGVIPCVLKDLKTEKYF